MRACSIALFYRTVPDSTLQSPTFDPAQLAALFDALPTAVVATAPETGEVLAANRAFCDLLALTSGEVVGAFPPYPWAPEGGASLGAEGEVEATYVCADGRRLPVGLELRPAAEAGGALVCAVTDLSERRRLEQQLVQNGRLAAVGELAAGVAHEVNNPLFAILGLTEFLAQDAAPGSKAAERLELIRRSGEEIREIVRALLDFARENPEERRTVALADVVRQSVALVRRTTAHKGIELVPSYHSDALVRASSNQLKQVFLSLIANSRQAMGSEGVIRIDVRRDGGDAVAVVSDDGPGVASDVAHRIFDPFFSTKGAGSAAGLGLSVSLGIAQAHGGSLTLSDRPGPGATFVLRLPLALEGDL